MPDGLSRFVALFALMLCLRAGTALAQQEPAELQYEFGNIAIPAASADEPRLDAFSLEKAVEYLEGGATAWSKQQECVSCHTNGTYLLVRPSLTPHLGRPSTDMREFFVSQLAMLKSTERETLTTGVRPTQIAYLAAGLAEWDLHIAGKLSAETDQALRLMFSVQSEDGSFHNANCWPPFESDAYHGSTVAAMAMATAPGWLANLGDKPLEDEPLQQAVGRLKTYLRKTPPLHDYSRVLLLWASTRLPDLLTNEQQQELVDVIWKHQREDGGWSLRTFAAPHAWGRGNRAEKLRSEPDFENPASDGHQTGLCVLVLREADVPADDPRIRKAARWLLSNQRESGRWWTRSLNTDEWHFITYSGTCYPLLALARCNQLPAAAGITAP